MRIEIRHRLYIGIILDGVGKFENLSANVDTRNYGRLSVTSTPEFHGSSEDEVFKFTSGQPIGIKVGFGNSFSGSREETGINGTKPFSGNC